jgi:hypothetical protein
MAILNKTNSAAGGFDRFVGIAGCQNLNPTVSINLPLFSLVITFGWVD